MTRDFPESYLPLCQRLGLDRGIPWTPNWTAAADFLELLVDELEARRPAVILECGSGLSTLVLARACEMLGAGRVVSLEQEAACAEGTRKALAAYGLEARAEVLDAPLVEWRLGGESWPWYDLDRVECRGIELLVVDGPPGRLRPLARYPALPLLASRLEKEWVLLLDDAARDEERAVVARWCEQWPGLRHRYLPLERGCSRLQGSLETPEGPGATSLPGWT